MPVTHAGSAGMSLPLCSHDAASAIVGPAWVAAPGGVTAVVLPVVVCAQPALASPTASSRPVPASSLDLITSLSPRSSGEARGAAGESQGKQGLFTVAAADRAAGDGAD